MRSIADVIITGVTCKVGNALSRSRWYKYVALWFIVVLYESPLGSKSKWRKKKIFLVITTFKTRYYENKVVFTSFQKSLLRVSKVVEHYEKKSRYYEKKVVRFYEKQSRYNEFQRSLL